MWAWKREPPPPPHLVGVWALGRLLGCRRGQLCTPGTNLEVVGEEVDKEEEEEEDGVEARVERGQLPTEAVEARLGWWWWWVVENRKVSRRLPFRCVVWTEG